MSNEYRKKPVVIQAVQWFKVGDHPNVRPYWTHDPGCKAWGWIETLEGGHIVTPGDWIITGVKGEHYPCKPDIFAATYEPAALAQQPQAEEAERQGVTMADAVAAVEGTLHGAIDYWQARALAAEAKVPSEAVQDAHETNARLADHYIAMTCGTVTQSDGPVATLRITHIDYGDYFRQVEGVELTAAGRKLGEGAYPLYLHAALAQQPQHNKVTDAQRDAVARAICIACEDHPDSAGDSNIGGNRNEFRWQDYRDVADAAIQAMQKETK